MTRIRSPIVAIAAVLCIIAAASQASAQTRGSREAAIQKCMAQIQSTYPQTGPDRNDAARVALYKSCMHNAGYRP